METKTIIKLANGTEIEVKAGTLRDIMVTCEDRAAAETLQKSITEEALTHVEIIMETPATEEGKDPERVVTGIYENITGEVILPIESNSDGSVTVKISLREKDRTEMRLASLEESAEMLAAALLA